MEIEYYQKMYDLEETHWWFVGKRRIIFGLLKNLYSNKSKPLKILDVGYGTGIMLHHLRKYGQPVGIDFSKIGSSLCQKRGPTPILQASALKLPFANETFDLITCLEVLCHRQIEDDGKALREFYRVLKKGGRVVISDPAYNFLWSGHDISEEVRERYTKKGLTKKMKETGFSIEKATYWNTFLLPLVFTIRMTKNLFLGKNKSSSDLWTVPLLLNKVLTLVLRLEACLLHRINLPFGVSVLCLGRK